MKILQIINSLDTGGAEKLLLETIPLYKKKGIEMDLLLLDGKEYPFLKQLVKQECCQVYRLENGSIYNPFHIFKIIPYLKKYDIVHVHLFPSLYWVSIAKMLGFIKTPLIYTEHNTNNRRRKSTFFKFMDNLFYNNYARIVTISDDVDLNLKDQLNAKFVERIQLIKNGVNLNKLNLAKPYLKEEVSVEKEDAIIVQVSSFTTQKDQLTLVKALTSLPDKVKLLLIGDGALIEDVKVKVSSLKLQDRVQFLGIRMDVPKLLKTADIVVLSSNYEGLSLSSVEGLASGRPFVASNVSGLKDVVGGAGLLFEKGNYKELARHINDLLEDEFYYNKISARCLKRSKEYDINGMIEKYIVMFEELFYEK